MKYTWPNTVRYIYRGKDQTTNNRRKPKEQTRDESYTTSTREAQSLGMSTSAPLEVFMFSALFKLLVAAPYDHMIPIIPKLREFINGSMI